MPPREYRWKRDLDPSDVRAWLVVDGRVTHYYTRAGHGRFAGDYPWALFERLPGPPGVPTYRRLAGFQTRAALQAWIREADQDWLDDPGGPGGPGGADAHPAPRSL